MTQVIFHLDMDAFYASVEQRDDPRLRGKPVVVGARPGGRGVVSACSYEARRYGIRSAMPTAEARRLCPQAIFLPVRMDRYRHVSRRIMAMLDAYTPAVQQISVDEAFLDMTGTERLFGPPRDVATRMKKDVREKTGLAVSIGVGSSRFIAKMASDYDKPDGLWVVQPGDEQAFVAQLELKDLWGLGGKTRRRLEAQGIKTVPELRGKDLHWLRGMFGPASGEYMYRAARGIDPGILQERSGSHSMSSETTFEIDVSDPETIHLTLLELAEETIARAYYAGLSSRTVTVKFRYTDFSTFSARRTVSSPVQSADQLTEIAEALLNERRDPEEPLRLLGLGLSDVKPENEFQGELFSAENERSRKVEEVIMDLRKKRADVGIHRASLMGKYRRGRQRDERERSE